MFKFEKVSKYAHEDIAPPVRKTEDSACYDMVAAEDVIIQPYQPSMNALGEFLSSQRITPEVLAIGQRMLDTQGEEAADRLINSVMTCTLDEAADLTKMAGLRPALVPTGYKAYMDKGYSLDLYVRSSSPLKYWLIMANSTEGEIFFQLINLLPFPIKIRKGEIIGQAKFVKYQVTDDDAEQEKAKRVGGFGSTSEVVEEITPEIIKEEICL